MLFRSIGAVLGLDANEVVVFVVELGYAEVPPRPAESLEPAPGYVVFTGFD